MRYFRLLGTFIRASFQQEASHRSNFYMRLLSTALGLAGSIGGIAILFTNSDSVNGWSLAETSMVLGVYLLVQALKGLVFTPSLNQLAGMDGELEKGTFDYVLLRPVSKLFLISFRKWSLWTALNILAGIGVLAYAGNQLRVTLTLAAFASFLLTLLIAMAILYSVMLFLSTLAFWYRGTYMLWILDDALQTGRYPVGMYPQGVQIFLTWVVPVGFIVTVPAQALLGQVEVSVLIAGLLLGASFLLAARSFFAFSLRKYTSASS